MSYIDDPVQFEKIYPAELDRLGDDLTDNRKNLLKSLTWPAWRMVVVGGIFLMCGDTVWSFARRGEWPAALATGLIGVSLVGIIKLDAALKKDALEATNDRLALIDEVRPAVVARTAVDTVILQVALGRSRRDDGKVH